MNHLQNRPWANRPVLFVLVLGVTFALTGCAPPASTHVNFRHLEHLTETISLQGREVDIVHVYANYPDYKWMGAAESGSEGIACVDDAARGAVVYLRHYELTRNELSRVRAKRLLEFVLMMQSEDGQFYNFLLADHTINRNGKTSFKSFGWWAARAVWSLGMGCRVLHKDDPQFASQLVEAFHRSLPRVKELVSQPRDSALVNGYLVPRWLPYRSGADVTSELALGLAALYAAEPDSSLKSAIETLADGVMMMQDGDIGVYPYGAHRSWETLWHMWGNSQTQMLATAGKLLGSPAMMASAEREARGSYTRLLVDGFMKEFDVAKPGSVLRYEQIAYAVRPMAVGLLRLYDATGKREYLTMAGLAGSWLFGNNVLHRPVYDDSSGRCYDGIRDSVTLNMNSGAESTIEALYTLVEIEQYPDAEKYLRYTKVSVKDNGRYHTALFRNAAGDEATIGTDTLTHGLIILTGDESRKFQEQLP